MFCTQCGKEIEDDARFCPHCGQATGVVPTSGASTDAAPAEAATAGAVSADDAASSASANDASTGTADGASAAAQPVVPMSVAVPESSTAKSAAAVVSATSSPASSANLKAATANSRKKSLRKMPLIVLVALAMLLVSSVAFAAYMVYTNLIAPQAQEQPVQEQAQEQQAEPEYSIETVTVEVSVPTDPYVSSGARTTETWSYDQITCTQQSDVVDAVNAEVKAAFDASVQLTESTPADADGYEEWLESSAVYESCLQRRIAITYMGNDTVCFTDYRYETMFGADSWPVVQGVAYSLSTGEIAEMGSLFGLDDAGMQSAATGAVRSYLETDPSDLDLFASKPFEASIAGTRGASPSAYAETGDDDTWLEGSANVFLTEDGLVYATSVYELGSGAYGCRYILFAAFNDDSLVGTEVDADAIFTTPLEET